MTKRIPEKQKQEMTSEPFYGKCCVANSECSGKIEFHHNLIFAGKRQNCGILPVCQYHHRIEASIKDRLNWIMLNRMSDQELTFYSKAENLFDKKDRLNKLYGTYH